MLHVTWWLSLIALMFQLDKLTLSDYILPSCVSISSGSFATASFSWQWFMVPTGLLLVDLLPRNFFSDLSLSDPRSLPGDEGVFRDAEGTFTCLLAMRPISAALSPASRGTHPRRKAGDGLFGAIFTNKTSIYNNPCLVFCQSRTKWRKCDALWVKASHRPFPRLFLVV